IGAQALIKATKVDGIYDKDPKKFDDAQRFERISYGEVLERNLKVMDLAAIALSSDNQLPIQVFNFTAEGHLERLLAGEVMGTLVGGKNA
ncbi:MAG: UMP kinase, partial [Planctomycetes bacterium]|nr:UMP kinase [Planctomycetota bacterium]